MKITNRRTVLKSSAATVVAALLPKSSWAQASSYSAEDLKGSTLTPFGSIRAGNADGTISAWTGENLALPAGFQEGTSPQFFTDEKPLYSITGANYTKYQDKLPAGAIALLQKYPNFRLDVYPTHRTAIAPQYVYDNIYKNATNAQLSADGNSVTGAYGGIPFPFPKNGNEVMWNHELSWQGTAVYYNNDAHLVSADGSIILESRVRCWQQFPYYFENGEERWNGFFSEAFIEPIAPPYQAGANIINLQPTNQLTTPVEAWEYLVGQRRVRRAPELQYDTPNSISGGTSNWDEAFIFSGKLNEYRFDYLGVKEIYVPYNCNKFNSAAIADQFQPDFINPDLTRWELHRVKVVNMTLLPGSRNVDARRVMYYDDDGGSALMADVYDASGALWKFQHNMPGIFPNVPAVVTVANFNVYDLHAGNYSSSAHYDNEVSPQWKPISELPASFMTPGQLAATAGGY